MNDICVVIPLYNEKCSVVQVIHKWCKVLDGLDLKYLIIVIDDCSSDNSYVLVSQAKKNIKQLIVDKNLKNLGHGPTILRGYKQAVDKSQWILQVDSDDEIKASEFPKFWRSRSNFDLLVGLRNHTNQPVIRQLCSLFSRMIIFTLFGKGIWDVNCGYRLFRSDAFSRFFPLISNESATPNILMSGYANYKHLRVKHIPITLEHRRFGTVSLNIRRILRISTQSFFELIRLAYVLRTS